MHALAHTASRIGLMMIFGITFSSCLTGPSITNPSSDEVTGNSSANSAVDPGANATVTFPSAVVAASVTPDSAYVVQGSDCSASALSQSVSLDSDNTTLTLPATLTCSSSYAICLTDDIVFEAGGHLSPQTIAFSTAPCKDITEISLSVPTSSYVSTFTFSGTTSANSTIDIYSSADCSGSAISSGTADTSGNFSIPITLTADGDYVFTAKGTNSGQLSNCSSSLSYTLYTAPPTLALSSASASLVRTASAAVTYTVTYTGALGVSLSTSDITLNTTGTATCTAGLSGSGLTTRTVSLSGCTGNGTVGFSIASGTAASRTGVTSAAGGPSAVITVDNTIPVAQSFTPSTSTLTSIPSSITATIDESVDSASVSAADFTIGGSCAGVSVSSTSVLNSTITIALAGTGGCTLGQTVSISLDLSGVTDSAGNAGANTISATYTRDNVGPTSATFSPVTSTRSTMPASVTVTYNENASSTSVSAADFSLSGTCAGASISSISTSGDSNIVTVNLAGTGTCTNTQTIILTSNFAGVTDTLGNAGSGSSAVTYTFDNAGPTISSVTPVSATVRAVPSVLFTYSTDVDPTSITSADFSISGNCAGVSVSTVSASSNVATVVLAGTTGCTHGQTVTVTGNLAGVVDQSLPTATAGAGSSAVTYVLDLQGPSVSSFSPSTSNVAAISSSVSVTLSADVDSATVSTADFSIGGTCVGTSISSVGMVANVAVVNLAGTGGCTSGQTVQVSVDTTGILDLRSNPGTSTSTVTYTLDTVGPTVSTISPTTSTVASIPAAAVFTLSTDVDSSTVSAADFSIGGTCVGVTISSVGNASNVSTVNLAGTGGCTDGQTVQITANLATISDLVGNAGAGTSAVTYTLDTVGPTSSTNISDGVHNPMPSSVGVTFTSDVDSATMTIADFSIANSTCGGAVTVSGISKGANTAILTISGTNTCTNGQHFDFVVNEAGVADLVGNAGVSSASHTYTLDSVGPSVSSFSPTGGTKAAIPATIDVAWSADVDTSTITGSEFSLDASSTCAGAVIGGTGLTGTTSRVFLGNTNTCADGETVILVVDKASVRDVVGNSGSGTSSVTYTLDTTGPTATVNPVDGAAPAASIDVTWSADVDNSSIDFSDFAIDPTSTCGAISIVSLGQVSNVSTVGLNGLGGCLSGDTVVFNVLRSGVTDLVGNAGVGTLTATYLVP
jgi:hypothetical protein